MVSTKITSHRSCPRFALNRFNNHRKWLMFNRIVIQRRCRRRKMQPWHGRTTNNSAHLVYIAMEAMGYNHSSSISLTTLTNSKSSRKRGKMVSQHRPSPRAVSPQIVHRALLSQWLCSHQLTQVNQSATHTVLKAISDEQVATIT